MHLENNEPSLLFSLTRRNEFVISSSCHAPSQPSQPFQFPFAVGWTLHNFPFPVGGIAKLDRLPTSFHILCVFSERFLPLALPRRGSLLRGRSIALQTAFPRSLLRSISLRWAFEAEVHANWIKTSPKLGKQRGNRIIRGGTKSNVA